MSFSITILGSSSAIPTIERYPTAHLLNVDEQFYLIDCGEGTQMQLKKYNCKVPKINNIFISHLHGDHIFGLFGLLSTYMLLERHTPLNIFGNQFLKEILDGFLKNFGKGIPFKINFIPIKNKSRDKIWEDDKISVYSFPLKHSVPINGFVFKEKKKELNVRKDKVEELNIPLTAIKDIKKGADYTDSLGKKVSNKDLTLPPYKQRTYAFCTDTAYYERIVEDINGVDVLYHEATFKNADIKRAKKTLHATSVQAAKIATMANAGKLIIGHFSARYKTKDLEQMLKEARSVFPNTYLSKEGDEHKIELKRKKRQE